MFISGDLNADFNTQNGWKLNQLCQIENLEVITNSFNFVKSVLLLLFLHITTLWLVFAYISKLRRKLYTSNYCGITKQADFQAFRNALSETIFDKCFSNGDVDDACTK